MDAVVFSTFDAVIESNFVSVLHFRLFTCTVQVIGWLEILIYQPG